MTGGLKTMLIIMRGFAGRIILSITLGVATICAGVGLLGTSGYLISSAALHPSIAELQVAIVGVRFFGLSRAIFRYLERLVSHSVNLRIVSKLRGELYDRLEPGAPSNLSSKSSGDLLERMMGDLETLENFYVRVFAPAIVAVVITIGMGIFVGSYLLEIGLIVSLGMLLNGFVLPGIGLWLSRRPAKRVTSANAAYSSLAVEYLQGLEDLSANSAEENWRSKIDHQNQRLAGAQRKINVLNSAQTALNLLVMNLTILAAVFIAIPLVNSGSLSGVSLAVILLLVSAGFEATVTLPQAAKTLAASREAAKRLFEIAQPQPIDNFKFQEFRHNPRDELRLESLSFRFPGDTRDVLNQVSFVLKRGQIKALIGLSGSGKTTLLNLFLKFQDPTSGSISLGGQRSTSIAADTWRRQFGVVGQSVYLFNTTLRENLLLAAPEATETQLMTALQRAGLQDWYTRLPGGLDSWVGEHGLRLSAGERQRLSIARLLLTKPEFILLDEPTANLDSISETQIFATLKDAFTKQGILMVTHRLDLLEQVDEILVLDGGQIAERGNLQELISRAGVFKKFYSIQRDLLDFSKSR